MMPEFTMPVTGKVIGWAPLSRRVKETILSAHATASALAMVDSSLMAARITSVDGAQKKVSSAEYYDLGDDAELELFEEHVRQHEALRMSSLREKVNMTSQSLRQRVEAAINQMDMASQQIGIAMKMALEAVDALAAASDPLDRSKP